MAYNAVPTAYDATPGWGSVWFNKYIKDNFAACVPDIFTTKGDIAVATAANVATRLAVGADGTVLWADSTTTTGVVWGGAGLVKANDADIQGPLNAVTWYQIGLDAEYYDLGGTYASSTFTAPHDGYYLVTAMIQFGLASGDFDVPDYVSVGIYKSDTLYSVIAGFVWVAASGSSIMSTSGADVVYLDRTNTLKFYGYIGASGVETYRFNPNGEDVSHHISITCLF